MDIIENPLKEKSAYHGGSWQPRTESHASDCSNSKIWNSSFGYNSEFESLSEALLLDISDSFPDTSRPEEIQFLQPLQVESLKSEYKQLELALLSNKVKVHKIFLQDFPNPSPNLLFCRDLFFSTPFGAILGRMGSTVRSGEEKFAQLALARLGIPIIRTITGRGTFEGADALWLDSRTILVGVGNRTNENGFFQIQETMNEFGIKSIKVSLPKKVQHLLGMLQIIDSNTALVRTKISSESLLEALRDRKIISVEETHEVVFRQALNFITIAPKKVLMAKHCPEMRSLLERNGVQICAELSIEQLIKGAGGLACATGILTRKLRLPGN